jgi:uncharacterized membrane-anchored protein
MLWLKIAAIAANVLLLALFIYDLRAQLQDERDKSVVYWGEEPETEVKA